MVKRRLYRLMRTLYTKNWPSNLQAIVRAINNSPNSAIGYLKPSQIKSPLDDPLIDNAIGVPQDASFETQVQNQKTYEQNSANLQVGDHVYLDFAAATMEKGFDTPVTQNTINTIIILVFILVSF